MPQPPVAPETQPEGPQRQAGQGDHRRGAQQHAWLSGEHRRKLGEKPGRHSDANDGLLNNGNLLDNSRMVSPTQNAMNGTGSLSGSRLATYSSQDSGLKGHDSLFKSQDPVYRPAGHDPIGPVGHDPIGPPNTKDSLFSTKTHQDSLYSGASQDSLFSNGRDSLFSKESTNVSSPEPWLFEGLSNGLNGLDLTQNLSQ